MNYFFGKDGGMPSSAQQAALENRPGSRHVSQNIEPSIAQSFRRGDTRQPAHVLEMVSDETDLTSPVKDSFEGGFVSNAGFLSFDKQSNIGSLRMQIPHLP